MTTIHIFYGTESGNAEMVADDIAEALSARGLDATTAELCDIAVEDFAQLDRAIVVTSTYGEGGLPESAAPFYDALVAAAPDLSGLEFAAFGLGDSTYETFNNAIDILSAALLERGARQLGPTGRHDAAAATDPAAAGAAWAVELTELVPA